MPKSPLRQLSLRIVSALIATLCLCTSLYASQTTSTPELDEFTQAILANRSRIKEFEQIKAIAESMGLRVFLMGGLASSYAHYVSMDLERLRGDTRYDLAYFDYHWDNIFRHSQDIDLAVTKKDGSKESEEDINTFKTEVQKLLAHKKVDIFGLHTSLEGRPALFDKQSDFHKQNTDSASTGIIEITDENKIEDISDSTGLHFLQTFLEKRVQLRIHPEHKNTKRFKESMNPEFFVAIRLLINASRYGLRISPEDFQMIKALLEQGSSESLSDYSKRWLESNASKIVTQSIDLEESMKLIQEAKVVTHLSSHLESKSQRGSALWYLTRQPLPSFSIGIQPKSRKKKTAAELGISTIAHSTPDLEYLLQITSNPFGIPNVFKSINDRKNGQAALYGDGVYVRQGILGNSAGAYQILFELNPKALEDIDFRIVESGDVLVLNRNALKFIPTPAITSINNLFEALRSSIADFDQTSLSAFGTKNIRLEGNPEQLKDFYRRATEIIVEHGEISLGLHLLSRIGGESLMIEVYRNLLNEHFDNQLLFDKLKADTTRLIEEYKKKKRKAVMLHLTVFIAPMVLLNTLISTISPREISHFTALIVPLFQLLDFISKNKPYMKQTERFSRRLFRAQHQELQLSDLKSDIAGSTLGSSVLWGMRSTYIEVSPSATTRECAAIIAETLTPFLREKAEK